MWCIDQIQKWFYQRPLDLYMTSISCIWNLPVYFIVSSLGHDLSVSNPLQLVFVIVPQEKDVPTFKVKVFFPSKTERLLNFKEN